MAEIPADRLVSILTRDQTAGPQSPARLSEIATLPRSGVHPCDIPSDAEVLADTLDRSLHAVAARFTGGLSPAALIGAYMDWATHLAMSPGKRMQLVDKGIRKSARLAGHIVKHATPPGPTDPCIEPLPQDRRFENEVWQKWPYNLYYQSFLLQQQWWHNATIGVRGVTKQHENVVEFAARQILDMVAPSNFFLTNPELQQKTHQQGGMNFVRGAQNFAQDWERLTTGRKPVGAEAFTAGKTVAVTPGKVVYRNRLIELIQYAPSTSMVHPEPVLIVPAWIMKYYILDLSPHNSLVKYLTDQGFTVFMVSWKNPGPEDRDLGMDDYRQLGIMSALETVGTIVPDTPIHAVGYCIGGTLLSIAAAAMSRDGDHRLSSVTLLAAQTDFTDAGELKLFINDSQLSFLDDMMWAKGFLDTKQMSGAFQLLRSNDLVWSRMLREYMMGERETASDLMAWNADATRMPYRMHSEYLRRLFLDNDLAEGRFRVSGKPVALSDVRVPIFSVGTVLDHVAPWQSVYKIHRLTDTEVTFLLTTGGHNAGIVSEPGHKARSYQVLKRASNDKSLDPASWVDAVPRLQGSWWPQWVSWLAERSSAVSVPPQMGASTKALSPLCDAPGSYVFQE
jgi:polyhydroxyalkanoate synthase subunit PhaC